MAALLASASLEAWRSAGADFDYNGNPIFYRDDGHGPALVCIHGFPTASWDWHKLWPQLTERFRVVAADMIGFGFSPKPPGYSYSIHDQATLHESLLQQLGIDFIHVLAHDYGDTVAQELLARYEERRRASVAGIKIESICFLNGGLFPEAHRARLVQKLLRTPLGPLLARLSSENGFRKSMSAIFGPETQPSEDELRTMWMLVSANDGWRVMPRLIRYIDERRRHRERWVGALQTTKVPLRFVNGALDPVSGRRMAERYRELVPNPDVVILDNIGHYPQLEDPEAVLRAFLELVLPLCAGGGTPWPEPEPLP
jgi:pimeloyl-ACP methyl ester carboxylesterase